MYIEHYTRGTYLLNNIPIAIGKYQKGNIEPIEDLLRKI